MNSLRQGRLQVVLAALLWSLSGFFIMMLTKPPAWLGDMPPVAAEQIACWRCLFGAVALLFLLRRHMIRWHPALLIMALCFALMNWLFVLSMALGDVAEASLLQYTAPFWVLIVNVVLLRRAKAVTRDWWALGIATLGIVVIVIGRFHAEHAYGACLSLGAGVASAGVIMCLSILSTFAPTWLALLNLLAAGLFALPWTCITPWPSGVQWLILIIFGTIQVAAPYWLMSSAVKTVPAHEAALLSLLDPLLAPFWAYLITQNIPALPTWLGGTVFVLALAIRYLPTKASPQAG